MSGASSLLRIASRRATSSQQHLLSSSSSRTFQNATAATLSSSNTNESNTNLNSIATALALVSGLSLVGSDRKKKADCAAIAAVVGKDEFDAR